MSTSGVRTSHDNDVRKPVLASAEAERALLAPGTDAAPVWLVRRPGRQRRALTTPVLPG